MNEELGFETILENGSAMDVNNLQSEVYCPDCYDCDYNCEEHG